MPPIGLCAWGHVQGMSPAVWRDERREPGAARSPQARRQNDLKGLRQKGSSTLMTRSLVWGMNDHQGLCWVLIVVTHTHRPLAATSGSSAPRSHRRKAVPSPLSALTPCITCRRKRAKRTVAGQVHAEALLRCFDHGHFRRQKFSFEFLLPSLRIVHADVDNAIEV